MATNAGILKSLTNQLDALTWRKKEGTLFGLGESNCVELGAAQSANGDNCWENSAGPLDPRPGKADTNTRHSRAGAGAVWPSG
jgi:hypothetical protein